MLVASLVGTAALIPRIDGAVPLHWGPDGIDRWGPPGELYAYPVLGLVLFGAQWALAAFVAAGGVPAERAVVSLALAWKRASVRLIEATFGILLACIVVFGLWTAIAASRGATPRVAWLIVGLLATLAPTVVLLPGVVRSQRALEARIGEDVGRSLNERQAALLLALVIGLPLVLLLLVALVPALV